MDIEKIKELALVNGFKLKEQASGNMDLNAYVYDFANAVEQAAKVRAVPEPNALLSASLDAIQKLGSGDFVLVPRVPTEEMIMNGLLVISTEVGKYDIQKEVRMIWEKMIEAQEQKG